MSQTITKEMLSVHVYTALDTIKKNLGDSPKSAKTHLDRLYGFCEAMFITQKYNDEDWERSILLTIESNFPRD
jgi:hypothetical protein